jgi:hypothetical protein
MGGFAHWGQALIEHLCWLQLLNYTGYNPLAVW